MGNHKKYEAHARLFPCVCIPVDVMHLSLAMASVGAGVSLWLFLLLFFNSTPSYGPSSPSYASFLFSGANIALFYCFSFGAIIFGVLTSRSTYLLFFMIYNGLTILLSFAAVVGLIAILLVGQDSFQSLGLDGPYMEQTFQRLGKRALEDVTGEGDWVPSNPRMVPFAVHRPAPTPAHLRAIVLLSELLALSNMVFVLLGAILLQSTVFHAFRFMRLRKHFGSSSSEQFPIGKANTLGPLGGNFNGNGNGTGYNISKMRKSIFS